MSVILTRIDQASDGIWGHLDTEDPAYHWLTLEHAYGKGNFTAKIPCGTYTCVRGLHRLADMPSSFETYEVTNVPAHTNILIHKGNFNSDTEGCILLGSQIIARNSRGQSPTHVSPGRMLVDSEVSFNRFMQYLNGAKSFELTIME